MILQKSSSEPAQTIRFRPAIGWVVLTALLVCAAQGQSPDGGLAGTVEDSSGGRIPGARIVALSTVQESRREAVSNARGEFRVEALAPGPYRIVVDAQGFAEAEAEVTVQVDRVRDLRVTLGPAGIRQTLEVRPEASSIAARPLDTASAVHQTIVTRQDLHAIPLAARSFANIAYLAPGTEPVEPSDPTKARITAVSTGGSSGLNNNLSVDGGDNSDDYIGGFLQNFSPEAIEEFSVRTAQEDADTGHTTAASVVITTKRGTDRWHGDEAFYERAAALNAGVFMATDGGVGREQWARVGTGLPKMPVTQLKFVSGHKLLAATYGRNGWILADPCQSLRSQPSTPGAFPCDRETGKGCGALRALQNVQFNE